MSDVLHKSIEWAGKHPVPVFVGVVVGGGVLIMLMRGGGGSSSSGDNGMSAFYAAQAAQANSGNQLMAIQNQDATALGIAQVNAGAATTINGQNTGAATTINGQNTDTALAITQTNDSTAVQLAKLAQPPAPVAPTPEATGYAPELMFNTLKPDQPILQGYDAQIASEIDHGTVQVGPGGVLTIPTTNYLGTTEPGGTFVPTSPLDQRWATYQKGSYTAGGSIIFDNSGMAAAH